jgi:fructoselysine-6-P-deglycase FrlB-like protein
MSHVEKEIATQPECWRSAAELASGAFGLPGAGERVAVIGCGTSLFMAQAYAALREAAGQGETDAFAASEFPAARRYDLVVALSRSGTTTEVLGALRKLPLSTPTTALTADPHTPIGSAATETIVLDFADEQSVVQTRFATSALVLLRAHLGEDVAPLVAQATKAVEEPLPEGAADAHQFTFLGQGWTVGVANEAALKLREASNSWTESYPAMEYRHGPISVTDGSSCVWVFGPVPAGLADEVRKTGATVVTGDLDPLADLIRSQRLAVALAVGKGLDPDRPRNLSRSVILPDASA